MLIPKILWRGSTQRQIQITTNITFKSMIKIMVGFERPAYKYHLYSQALIMAITQK